MKPWGIFVSNINPSFMRTPMVVGGVNNTVKLFDEAPAEIRDQYDTKLILNVNTKGTSLAEDPLLVVNKINEVLIDAHPPFNNLVGKLAHVARFFMMLPPVVQEWMNSLIVESPAPKAEVLRSLQEE